MSLHTAEEAHFLVRVGQWSIQDLQHWVNACADEQYKADNWEEDTWDDEWEKVNDDEC